MDWPLHFARNLTQGSPESGVGLCLLWTPQERVTAALPRDAYAVAGNLYSRDGISFLLRNVLARPTIRTILICGKDLTGSGAALLELMQHGVDAQHRIIGDGARLHPEIPREAIELFRRSVTVIDARDTVRPEAIAALLAGLPQQAEPFAPAPQVFPYSEPAVEALPAETSGVALHAPTVRAAYLKLLWHVMTFGQSGATQHSSTQRELLDVMTVVTGEPTDPAAFSYAEWMPFSRASLGRREGDGSFSGYLGQLIQAGQGDAGVSYTYGDRLRAYEGVDQIAALISALRASPESRRAVAALWRPAHDAHSDNPPCLNLVQARLRDERLHLTAYFRSHDIYRAWATNAYGLRALQGLIAEAVGATAGDLAIISHSAHVYAHDWEAARDLLAHHYRAADPRLVRDPRGSFVISLEPADAATSAETSIVVRHYTPNGERLQTFWGESARALGIHLAPYIGVMSHALYLGQELQKAELALRAGRPEAYRQDQDLDMDIQMRTV